MRYETGRKIGSAYRAIVKTEDELDAIGEGLTQLLDMKYGNHYPTVHNNNPYGTTVDYDRQHFTVKCRAAWSEQEAGLRDDIRIAYDIDPESRYETEIMLTRPWDMDPQTNHWIERGLDPANEWLRDEAEHLPMGTVPIAIRIAGQWRYLDDIEIASMTSVVRASHENPVSEY